MSVVSAATESDAPRGTDHTRLRILTAARDLFASLGTRGMTTREVATRANVNEATLFRHFGTKQQLVSAMLDHFSRLDLPLAPGDVEPAETIEAQLCALARAAIESMLVKKDLIRMTMAEEIMNPENHVSAWRGPSEARVTLVAFFARKEASGELRGDPELLACLFMSQFYSYVMTQKIWGPYDRPMDQVVPNIVELFLNGARA